MTTVNTAHPPQSEAWFDSTVRAGADRFAELLRAVKTEGLLAPQRRYYVAKLTLNLALFGGAWAIFALVGNSWWQVAVAVLLAFSYTQSGFVGHDIGHRQVARTRRWQDVLGVLHGNLMLGFSYGWWVTHHNKHHAFPNHLEHDSDITRRRVIFVPEQGFMRLGRAKQFIVRHQHIVFYPLLLTEAIGLRIASFRALKERQMRYWGVEAALIMIHLVAYITAVFIVMSPAKAIVFITVHQLLFGLHIGSVFAPNHKGMPIQRPDVEWDWMTRQVITARNLGTSRLTDFIYGGLNHQIEHHLFPTMPRRNLRRARSVTKPYCEALGLAYHEVSVTGSFAEILRHLRDTSNAYQAAVAVTTAAQRGRAH